MLARGSRPPRKRQALNAYVPASYAVTMAACRPRPNGRDDPCVTTDTQEDPRKRLERGRSSCPCTEEPFAPLSDDLVARVRAGRNLAVVVHCS